MKGWGLTQRPNEGVTTAEVLQNALVRHISDATCSENDVYGAQFNNETMFCAG